MKELIKRLRSFAEYEADLADESKWERIEWEAADLIESQVAEIENLQSLWTIAHNERSEAMLELAKERSLCDQLGNALEETVSDSHAALEYMYEAYGDRLIDEQRAQGEVCKQADEALTAWRALK